MDLKNKKITVVGLGKSGFAAALLAVKLGASVKVTDSSDSALLQERKEQLSKKGIAVELGIHSIDFIQGQDLVITSPGVADDTPVLSAARQHGIKIIDEIELAYKYCNSKITAVTGTNGKSTTVSLLAHIINGAGRRVALCGNIGNPFSGQVSSLKDDDIVILEVSSFQLSRIDEFRPDIAVFLNLSQNHLDRHKDLGEYAQAKFRIFLNQSSQDWAILNFDDELLKKSKATINSKVLHFTRDNNLPGQGAFIKDGEICLDLGGKCGMLCQVKDIKISGGHNLENALAASLAAFALGISAEDIADGLKAFTGLEHRNELVTELGGIRFINDSKSTTPEAAIRALGCCATKAVLIAGGRDKAADFSTIRDIVASKAKAVVLIGEARGKIKFALKGVVDIHESDSMEDAVNLAYRLARPDNEVLLSPMCASFDMFDDFEHRGEVFKEAVRNLK